MNARILTSALLATSVLASVALARPVVNQLSSQNSYITSQSRGFGFSSRAADDFTTAAGNGNDHKVTKIEVMMIGNGTASKSRFAVSIFSDNGGLLHGPGHVIKTISGASSVEQKSSLGNNYYKYLVTFNVSAGALKLDANAQYWISGYSNIDDNHNWGFAKSSQSTDGAWAQRNSAYPAGVFGAILPATDLAFKITSTQ